MEVLKDGASAIYGTDAIGGVINFILRKDYPGLRRSTANYCVTDAQRRRQQLERVKVIRGLRRPCQGQVQRSCISADYYTKQDSLQGRRTRNLSKTSYIPDLGLDRTS